MNLRHLALLTISVLSGCGRHEPSSAAAGPAPRDSAQCAGTGREWLGGAPPSLPAALEREAALRTCRDRWNSDATVALHGAFLTRLGGAHAEAGEVIKAVSRVDEGLTELETARRTWPRSGFLRTTHAITLSRLPGLFRKREAARDSLGAIARTEPDSTLRRLALEALARLRESKD